MFEYDISNVLVSIRTTLTNKFTVKRSGELLGHLSLNNNTVFCPKDLGKTGPQYRRRYDMGEVNTNG